MFGVRIIAFACALFGAAVSLPLDLAEARSHHSARGSDSQDLRKSHAQRHVGKSCAHRSSRKSYSRHHAKGLGPRPARWCGWWMRSQKGGGPELNLAWNWTRWGRPSGPQVGAVVVWPHHVGVITGRTASGWIVKSGNDGGRVRERQRSVTGAIFRTDSVA